jgi:hypothetical protein
VRVDEKKQKMHRTDVWHELRLLIIPKKNESGTSKGTVIDSLMTVDLYIEGESELMKRIKKGR